MWVSSGPMSTRTEIDAGKGNKVTVELALPPGEAKGGGVVLVQEWWGVNDHIRSLVDRLASEGFVVAAPDLYHGRVTTDPAQALEWVTALDGRAALGEIGATVAHLAAHPRGTGKVGVIGFCMGGAYALLSACYVPGLSAAVPFYGVPPEGSADYSKIGCAVLGHYAKNDEHVPPARAEAARDQLVAAGKDVTFHFYDAQHAFVNDTRPEVHHPENAKLAWERSVEFLKRNLG